MTANDAKDIRDGISKMLTRMDVLEAKIAALPDKAAIYTASLAMHVVIWTAIVGAIVVLNAFGAFH